MRALYLTLMLTCLALSGCGRIIHLADRKIGLEVLQISQTKQLDIAGAPLRAEEGERFLLVEVRIENTTLREEFPAPYTAFTLWKDDDKSIGADGASTAVEYGCDGSETLGKGAELTCWLVFAFDQDDEPVELQFVTPEDRAGRSDLSQDDCDWCGVDCTDLKTDPDNCGACGVRIDSDQECWGGGPVCIELGESLCGDTCVDLLTAPGHCGACDAPVPQGYICENGQPECPSSNPDECDDGCHNFSTDAQNCGGCGQDCGDGDCVRSGRCEDLAYTHSDDDALCTELCGSIGYDCSYGNVYYSTYYAYECTDQSVDCGEHADPDGGGYSCHIDSIYCHCYLTF